MTSRSILCKISQKTIWASRTRDFTNEELNKRQIEREDINKLHAYILNYIVLSTAAHIHTSDAHVTTCRLLTTGPDETIDW